MDLGLAKKVALVTGSTDGIGFAIAKRLAQEGATVYVNGRKKERVDMAIAKIGREYDVRPMTADLATDEGAKLVIDTVKQLDILVNNLGIYEVKEFEAITDQEWMHFFEVNVLSGIRLCRYYLPEMKKSGWGRIVFISSESAINIPTEMIHYGVTKTAQLSLTQGLAQACKGTKVTVNAVLPGPTYTEGVEKFLQEVAQAKGITKEQAIANFFRTVRPSSLIQRFATPDEVASLVAFVCSQEAAAMTGAILRHDGGITRSIM